MIPDEEFRPRDPAHLVAGSSGLVGGLVSTHLSAHPDVAIASLVRRGSSAPGLAIDFQALRAEPEATLPAVVPESVDVAIFCLGATIGTPRRMHGRKSPIA